MNTTNKWMIVGGAGYIGSALANELNNNMVSCGVFDDLSSGSLINLPEQVELFIGDAQDLDSLKKSFEGYSGVIHLAANKSVVESIRNPIDVFRRNVSIVENVLLAMTSNRIDNLIYASSAAVYGSNVEKVLNEKSSCNPINSYGLSKYSGERIIEYFSNSRRYLGLSPIKHTSLRFFNVAGTHFGSRDSGAHGLFPAIRNSLETDSPLVIFGNSHATKDGFCERDYVSVADVCASILKLVMNWDGIIELQPVYNVSSGKSYSVKEVIEFFEKYTGKSIKIEIAERNPSETSISCGSNQLIKQQFPNLEFQNLQEIVFGILDSG